MNKQVYAVYDPKMDEVLLVHKGKGDSYNATVFRFFPKGLSTHYDVYYFKLSYLSNTRAAESESEKIAVRRAFKRFSEEFPGAMLTPELPE